MVPNPVNTTRSEPAAPRLTSWRHLWKVPAFLGGLLVFGLVVLIRPLRGGGELRHLERDLAQARQLLYNQGDLDEIRALAEKALDQSGRYPQVASPAHFLLGSAHLKLAEKANGATAQAHLQKARGHLDQTDGMRLAEADRPRLQYQFGRTLHLLGEPPHKVVKLLEGSVEQGADDRAQGYLLLANCYLQLPTPNLEAALDANRRLLNLPDLREDTAATARLQHAELLLLLKDPAGARKALESVKAPAPAAVLARAHQLLAQSYQDEGDRWADAARLWKELADRTDSPRERQRALCHLAQCYRQLGQTAEAMQTLERVLAEAKGDEEQAAALGLAELRLSTEPVRAIEAFERVVREVKSASEWKNALVELKQVQERFEWACLTLRQPGRFEHSLRLAQVYEKIAPAGKAAYLQAQAAEAWAKASQGQAAADRFRQAATCFETSAHPLCTAEEQADRLWQAVLCALQIPNGEDAVAKALKALTATGIAPERVGEGWYRLAEKLRSVNKEDAALQAFTQATQLPGKFGYRARFHLAMAKKKQGDVDGAQNDLLANQALLAIEMDREAHEATVFELANLLFYRRDYRQAASRLQNALELYSDSPRAIEARYQLAECYNELAAYFDRRLRDVVRLTEETKNFYSQQYQQNLAEASLRFGELADLLAERRRKQGKLQDTEENLFCSSLFSRAECLWWLGLYDDAFDLYQTLATTYPQRVEHLHALSGVWRFHLVKGDDVKARATLDEFEKALKRLPESAFDKSVSRKSRKEWEAWLTNERRNDAKPRFNLNLDGAQSWQPQDSLLLKMSGGGR